MDHPSRWSIRDTLRVFNKFMLNPAMMRLAGRKHWYASVIGHTGRHSGRRYATPVVAETVSDGFIVPLPYGTHVDWLRNVLSAGQATIRVRDQTYAVVEPEIIGAESAAPQLSAGRRRLYRRLGIANFVKLKLAEPRG
ncbi:MAG: nitroreductase [Mycobacterium sp.]|uniref:nitroreductase n=1 Tax=Mycobacterium sp. TaxID=1785 RepID=UPI002635E687|nr:nitroreductase [Mycobacterium sp.]MDI3315280.1 nitroreductase [Mycobacterium sp.]MDI3315555.1 nitroreductase [Mycobacterium sp.]